MLRAYFEKAKKRKVEIKEGNWGIQREAFSLILPYMQWPERLICARVCKIWNTVTQSVFKETQEELLACMHKHWYNIRVSLPRFQYAVVPHGYQQTLFSAHHPQAIAIDHICCRALVIPGNALGYKESLLKKLPRSTISKQCPHGGSAVQIETFSVCLKQRGVLLLCLPLEYDTCWTPLNVLQTVNSVVHTKMPNMRFERAGIQYFAQPDLENAMLSFCCPCYIRYLSMCGFFWPHTRREFKQIKH